MAAEALTWFLIGACFALALVVIGGILAAVIGQNHSPLADIHYVD